MSIDDFIARCDAYAEKAGVTRAWVSKKLFGSSRKVSNLADRSAGVGVLTLERAGVSLDALEAALAARPAGDPDEGPQE